MALGRKIIIHLMLMQIFAGMLPLVCSDEWVPAAIKDKMKTKAVEWSIGAMRYWNAWTAKKEAAKKEQERQQKKEALLGALQKRDDILAVSLLDQDIDTMPFIDQVIKYGLQRSKIIRDTLGKMGKLDVLRKVDATGNTPLHMALVQENIPKFTTLLWMGADIHQQNAQGESPYMLIMYNAETCKDEEDETGFTPSNCYFWLEAQRIISANDVLTSEIEIIKRALDAKAIAHKAVEDNRRRPPGYRPYEGPYRGPDTLEFVDDPSKYASEEDAWQAYLKEIGAASPESNFEVGEGG